MPVGSSEKSGNPFYSRDEPQLQPEAIQILTQYSGIKQEDINTEVKEIREKAWQTCPYPCIGLYMFLDFRIKTTEQYPEIITRVKKGETFLDVGCCFGHAFRQMVVDGAPAENLTGIELEQEFIDLGFELFRDRESLRSHLLVGDIFHPKAAGLQDHTFDIIHAGAFIHMFTLAEQEEIVHNLLKLLKPQARSMIFGRQSGAEIAGEKEVQFARSGKIYRHNAPSFREMVLKVAKGLRIDLDVSVAPLGTVAGLKDDGNNWKSLSFSIVIKYVSQPLDWFTR